MLIELGFSLEIFKKLKYKIFMNIHVVEDRQTDIETDIQT